MQWKKSSFSNGSGGSNCLEVAKNENGNYHIRNSRYPDQPSLVFTPAEWKAFVEGVRAGEFRF